MTSTERHRNWTARLGRSARSRWCRRANGCRTGNRPTCARGSTSSAWPPWPRWCSCWHRDSRWPSAGPTWWHTSSLGHFVNSVHLWSVELFFACMVIHLWGKFAMAAWRGKRALTWITGAVAFVGSIGTAFTGYLSQTQLRLAVDLDAGQGRAQRRRHRRVLQRAQPGPDAAVAHRAAAAGARRADRGARDPRAPARRRPAVRRRTAGRANCRRVHSTSRPAMPSSPVDSPVRRQP